MRDPPHPFLLPVAFGFVALCILTGFIVGPVGIGGALDAFHAAIGLPVAVPDAVVLSADVAGQPISVLDNDRDSNGDRLVIVGVGRVEHGTLTFDGGVLEYSPDPGYLGEDHGRYTVRDPGGGASSADVLIEVVRNEPPVAIPDVASLSARGGAVPVLVNDVDPEGGPLRIVTVVAAGGGEATVTESYVQFMPAPQFSGIETLLYTVADELGLTSTASIDINVPSTGPCTGLDRAVLDEDDDGFDNADELVNGTSPCDAAAMPVDSDNDHTSDRIDPFYLDDLNGLQNVLPLVLTFETPVDGTVLGTGMTGVMSNTEPPETLLDPGKVRIEDGQLIVGSSTAGDALGAENAQRNALQVGVRMPAEPFVIHGRLLPPFSDEGFQSAGIYIGPGFQDDYLKLAVSAAGGEGGVKVTYEVAGEGRGAAMRRDAAVFSEPQFVDLFISVDPATGICASSYAIDGGERRGLGESSQLPLPGDWTGAPRALAVGIVITPELHGDPYEGHWDLLEITYER